MEDRQDDEDIAASKPIVKLFWCYADRDKKLRDHLERHLSALKHSGCILMWHDREILPGTLWEAEIETRLNSADLVIPLVSAHFLSSTYCWGVEMHRALERWKQGELAIVPILASSVDYKGTPISDFQVLPTNGRAITDWPDHEKAYTDAATGIRCAVDVLLAQKWKQRGDAWKRLSQYDLALTAYEEALQRDPQNPILYNDKGDALFSLKQFENAITVYDKAIELKPDFGLAYQGKGRALEGFAPLAYEKYQRLAEQAYQKAHSLENAKRRKKGGL